MAFHLTGLSITAAKKALPMPQLIHQLLLEASLFPCSLMNWSTACCKGIASAALQKQLIIINQVIK